MRLSRALGQELDPATRALLADFEGALADGDQLQLVYQPIVAMGSGRVTAVDEPVALGSALDGARGGEGPAVLVLPIAFDPAEEIPPYSERPEEIRARFRL